jgi:hypothetical protein
MPTVSSSTENCFSNHDSEAECGKVLLLDQSGYGATIYALSGGD